MKTRDKALRCSPNALKAGEVMYILGVDFETSGLEENRDVVTEIGAVLWDWEGKKPVLIMSELVSIPENVEINPDVVEVNGITREILDEFGSDPVFAFGKLNKMVDKADYIMAHNAEFDKKFYVSSMKRAGIKPVLCDKFWLDSAVDVNYPKNIRTRKLVFLAAEHNFLNPFAHRAVFDVLTMFQVVRDYDINDIVKLASEQKYELKANVLFDDRQKAKDRGFYWDGTNKIWIKTVRESEMDEEVKNCNFKVLWRNKGSKEDWKEFKDGL